MASFSGTSGIKKGWKRHEKRQKAENDNEEDKEINAYLYSGGRWLEPQRQQYVSVDGQEVNIRRLLLPPLKTLDVETLEQLIRGALGPDVEFDMLTFKHESPHLTVPFFACGLEHIYDMLIFKKYALCHPRVELYVSLCDRRAEKGKKAKKNDGDKQVYLYYGGTWIVDSLDDKRWVNVDGQEVKNCRLLLPLLKTLKFETLQQLIRGALPPNVVFGTLRYKTKVYPPFPFMLRNDYDMVPFKKAVASGRRVEVYVSCLIDTYTLPLQ